MKRSRRECCCSHRGKICKANFIEDKGAAPSVSDGVYGTAGNHDGQGSLPRGGAVQCRDAGIKTGEQFFGLAFKAKNGSDILGNTWDFLQEAPPEMQG
jgi:hypothetical protein